MRRWPAFMLLIIFLIEFSSLRGGITFAQPYAAGEDLEFRIWSLLQEIKIEEKNIKILKNRHRAIIKEKERVKAAYPQSKAQARRVRQIERVLLAQENKSRLLQRKTLVTNSQDRNSFHLNRQVQMEAELNRIEKELVKI